MTYQLYRLGRYNELERKRIEQALLFAQKYHATQKRISGEPYITHLFAVAQFLIDEFSADATTVIAGLLHDTVEDTTATLSDVEKQFGEEIRFLVDGATDVGRGDGREPVSEYTLRWQKSREKIEDYAKKDQRLLLVKIADRWHNMLTCDVMRPANQLRLAHQTLAFHVPSCRSLGFEAQADQIERICNEVIKRVEQTSFLAKKTRYA